MRRTSLALLTASLFLAPAAAQAGTAQAWEEGCAVFLQVMRGQADGSDAELSYCVGQTEGIVEAMKTGSQIGAVAFGGLLAVEAGMNKQAVFELFKRTDPNRLLGICRPTDSPTSAVIEAVHTHLERNPAKRALPVTAVFYDALQEKFPCPKPETPAASEPAK